jgi:nucleoside-diphosphate-sugar epimerase
MTAGGTGPVVVTGASGSLGRALVTHLARTGVPVRALVRDPAAFARDTPGVPAARCELPDVLDDAALTGASAVVHAAYATREIDPERARRVNEDGTRRLLEASRRAGVPRFVFVSTVAAAPDAPNYYARSKHALEQLLDPARDLAVRPGLILARHGHGLFQQLMGAMERAHVVPLFGGGTQPLQTVHVDDLCEAFSRALARGLTGTLHVAEPEPLSLGAFLRMAAARRRVRCLFVPLPFAPVLAGLRLVETLRLPFPLRSESLLGMKGLRRVAVEDDLRRLDLRVRSAAESLESLS